MSVVLLFESQMTLLFLSIRISYFLENNFTTTELVVVHTQNNHSDQIMRLSQKAIQEQGTKAANDHRIRTAGFAGF